MTPLNGNCLIRPDERPKQIGSIVIPANHRVYDLPNTGIVVEIAKGVQADFVVGNHVMYDHHKSDITQVKGFALVKAVDVLAVL